MNLLSKLIKMTSDTHLSKYPMFVSYKPNFHKLKGYQIREVLETLQSGDILLRRYDGFLNTIFTPGFWGHAAIYMGSNLISHAIGEGIVIEDILDFCRTDHICIMRFKDNNTDIILEILRRAENILKEDAKNNIEYDYMFESGNNSYYCTEYVDICYCSIFCDDYIESFGKTILLPDAIRHNQLIEPILEIKN